ncbi:hypothetical protein RRG08_013903 [Elysia crispata]|uniref:Uncharacterized protein n=1 Tax=Elysia crispata TaxID=231223 RepID=A0AAE0XT01_9GAST|nr:hypothetical protein RRG08_013903 [Elysia crispata]
MYDAPYPLFYAKGINSINKADPSSQGKQLDPKSQVNRSDSPFSQLTNIIVAVYHERVRGSCKNLVNFRADSQSRLGAFCRDPRYCKACMGQGRRKSTKLRRLAWSAAGMSELQVPPCLYGRKKIVLSLAKPFHS